MTTLKIIQDCAAAKRALAAASTAQKNDALGFMAEAIEAAAEEILAANALDVRAARGSVPDVMLDRLSLDGNRIKAMADGVRQVALLPDPVGLTLESKTRYDGLKISKISVPLDRKSVV